MYAKSIQVKMKNFGVKKLKRIDWYKKFTKIKEVKYSKSDVKN